MDELEKLEGVLDKYTFFSYQQLKKPSRYYTVYPNRYYTFQKARRTLISLFEHNRIWAVPREICTEEAIDNLMQIKEGHPSLCRMMFRGLELKCIMSDVLIELKGL